MNYKEYIKAGHYIFSIVLQVIDVGIISYIFYRAFLLIKHTRTFQMMRGLIILFIATIFASLFNLIVLEWLLRGFWAVSLVVVVIVFQPEIRSALAEVGRSRISNMRLRAEIVEELVKALEDFSKRKIGAIIVLEKEVGLKNYIESGVKIDAILSWELLKTIFIPKTPLHDGAVIIRRNTIAAASCFLPLTRQDLPKTVGTRHRAALGIAEVSDAIVLVVSEETGNVSIVCDGNIRWNVGSRSLKEELHSYYRVESRTIFGSLRNFFRIDTIKKNFSAKLVSLFLAVVLWYYVMHTVLR